MEQKSKRTADIRLQISAFEVPPVKDVLVIGKKSPIGSCGAIKCMEAIAPSQYTLIPVNDNDMIEAILLRKNLLKTIPEDKLLNLIVGETENLMDSKSLYKISIDINVSVSKTLEL